MDGLVEGRDRPSWWSLGLIRDTVRAPYNTISGRDCVKSPRLCLHGTCSQSGRAGGNPVLVPLGFECSRHRRTSRPSVERIRRKALLLSDRSKRFSRIQPSYAVVLKRSMPRYSAHARPTTILCEYTGNYCSHTLYRRGDDATPLPRAHFPTLLTILC